MLLPTQLVAMNAETREGSCKRYKDKIYCETKLIDNNFTLDKHFSIVVVNLFDSLIRVLPY